MMNTIPFYQVAHFPSQWIQFQSTCSVSEIFHHTVSLMINGNNIGEIPLRLKCGLASVLFMMVNVVSYISMCNNISNTEKKLFFFAHNMNWPTRYILNSLKDLKRVTSLNVFVIIWHNESAFSSKNTFSIHTVSKNH